MRGTAGFVIPVAGGAACFAEDGSPMNKVVGLGFRGVPSSGDLDEIERAFAARGVDTQVELANLADPEIGAALTGRGYRLVSFENVLGRALHDDTAAGHPAGGRGPVVRRPRRRGSTWWSSGFAHPDAEGVPSHEEFPREIVENAVSDVEQAGATPYLAFCDGVVAGGGSMRMSDGVAQLTGAATAPAYRRRGVQTALLSVRLADAARAGCDSPSSRRSRDRNRSRTCSAGAFTCSTRVPCS